MEAQQQENKRWCKIQIQHLLKLNGTYYEIDRNITYIQIQHLLKLNLNGRRWEDELATDSNTTLVKVKLNTEQQEIDTLYGFKYNTC